MLSGKAAKTATIGKIDDLVIATIVDMNRFAMFEEARLITGHRLISSREVRFDGLEAMIEARDGLEEIRR